MTGDAAESQGHEDHDRRDRQRDQRQPQVDEEQQPTTIDHDQHLAQQIQGQRHDVREVLVSEVTRLTILPEEYSS